MILPGLASERTDPAQPLPRARRRGALGRARSRRCCASAGTPSRCWSATSAALAGRRGPVARRRRDARAAGWRPVRSREAVRAHRRRRRARAQRQPAARRRARSPRRAAAGAARRDAPAQLPPLLRDRDRTTATAPSARAAGAATRCPGVRLRCRGNLPEAAVYGAGLWRQQPRIAGGGRTASWRRARFAADRLAELGLPRDRIAVLHNFLPASRVRGRRRRTAGPSTRCSPGGWSRRRASTPRSRRPRAPACRWRSPAPVPRPSRSRRLRGAPARPCGSSGRWSRPSVRAALAARGLRRWRPRAGTSPARTR